MLSKKEALDKCLEIYNDYRAPEQRRLARIDAALHPALDSEGMPKPRLELPEDAPPLLHQLAAEAETNYLALLLETYSQTMHVDSYITKSDAGGKDPWDTWQRNRMDSRQVSLHRSALAYSAAYASAIPGITDAGEDLAAVRLYTPKSMTALYQDEEWDDWPVWAVSFTSTHWTLIGDSEVHIFGREKTAPPTGANLSAYAGDRHLVYIQPSEHDLGVTPVVRYRDRHYLPGDKMLGIVEPLLPIQRRIDRTSANQMIAQQIAIFKQKYSIGWVPDSEEEEIKASIAKVLYLDRDPSEVQLGEWSATDIDPYINAGNQARRDFAATGQIPAQAMGIDGISNISDATLAGLEAAKNRRAGLITTSLGESHEQLMRLFATIDGNTAAAQDYGSEVVWRDFEARSFAQSVDGLVKLVGIGLPADIAMEDVPGMSGQRLKRIQAAMRVSRGREILQAALDRQSSAQAQQPNATPVSPQSQADELEEK